MNVSPATFAVVCARLNRNEDLGRIEYEATCALCHGPSGKGDGIYVDQLKKCTLVANLSELSRKNRGAFPFDRLYEMIDGREYVKAHGSREMPDYRSIHAPF